MRFLSKATEISKLNDLIVQKIIKKKEYVQRLSAILDAQYRLYDAGIEFGDEDVMLAALVDRRIISKNEYKKQWKLLKRCEAFGNEEAPTHSKCPRCGSENTHFHVDSVTLPGGTNPGPVALAIILTVLLFFVISFFSLLFLLILIGARKKAKSITEQTIVCNSCGYTTKKQIGKVIYGK